MDGEKSMRPQSYTKKYRQLSNAGGGRGDPSQERAHQMVVQCQTVIPENIHTSNVI